MIYQAETLSVRYLEDGIALLAFNAPGSVNKFDLRTLESFGSALDALHQESDLKGLILASDKSSFIVGADITEFLSLFTLPEDELSAWLSRANDIFNKLEDLPVPTLSAINGHAWVEGVSAYSHLTSGLSTPPAGSAFLKPNSASCPGLAGQ